MKTPYAVVLYGLSKYISKRTKEVFSTPVEPKVGSILKCSFFELDHSGIYIGDNKIVEVYNGYNRFGGSVGSEGLIRIATIEQFLTKTAFKIYVACSKNGEVINNLQVAEQAKMKVNKKVDYNIANNNCHKFVCDCISESSHNLSLYNFAVLCRKISKELNGNKPIVWHQWRY